VHLLRATARGGVALAATHPGAPGATNPRPTPPHVRPDSWRAGPLQWVELAAVATAALAADQITKAAISSSLHLNESVDLVAGISLWHVRNQGIAFGVFAHKLPIVSLLTAAAVGWMVLFFSRSAARHPLVPVAVGLLLGGSVSNLWDRLVNGYVTDFIDLRWWPTFNFADSVIVLGVGLLLWILFRAEPPRPEPAIDLTNR
jgi:signal peptidase II